MFNPMQLALFWRDVGREVAVAGIGRVARAGDRLAAIERSPGARQVIAAEAAHAAWEDPVAEAASRRLAQTHRIDVRA